ncbi:hypothetical protein U1Q18_030289 [Sarracenia purpurea var. burkii]
MSNYSRQQQAVKHHQTPAPSNSSSKKQQQEFSAATTIIGFQTVAIFMQTGAPDKSVAAVDSISDIVLDSPQKIFIGGISKAISSEMLMEIVNTFGPLKAYHFKVNMDLNEPFAFLEYVDQSVTLKACAGLNGMRLGGQMLTVVLATPDASMENIGNSPFYGIPDHAKALLEKPTHILKLRNVLDPEGLSLLSEEEMEEVLEDTRLECARFGTVKSVNVVKYSDHHSHQKTCEVCDNLGSASDRQDLNCKEMNTKTETCEEHIDHDSKGMRKSELPKNAEEAIEVDKDVECDGMRHNTPTDEVKEDEMCNLTRSDSKMAIDDPTSEDCSMALEEPNHSFESKDQIECCDGEVDDTIQTTDTETEHRSMEANGELPDALAEMGCGARTVSDALDKGEYGEGIIGLEDVFEPGCVLVEYRRMEAACMAAHSLHGRLFDNRMVTVGYVDSNIYKARFPK